jgi:hydrogenase expression/formation protein HypE
MLGFDVLNIANEGKFVAVVANRRSAEFVRMCRSDPLGLRAACIGFVAERQSQPTVMLNTNIGGSRIVSMPYGRELPRIC